jgi:hypothetical protein
MLNVSDSYNCFPQLIHHVNKYVVPDAVDNLVDYAQRIVGNLFFSVVNVLVVDKFSTCQRVTHNLYRDIMDTFQIDR